MSANPVEAGFVRGRGHPCVFHHPVKGIKTLVHGDDYVPAGTEESLAWLEKGLEKAYEIKTQKLGDTPGYKQEGKVRYWTGS